MISTTQQAAAVELESLLDMVINGGPLMIPIAFCSVISLAYIVERSIRPIALSRKNALFAGSDKGGVHWGVIASLIETCKLNDVDPKTAQPYDEFEHLLSDLGSLEGHSHFER